MLARKYAYLLLMTVCAGSLFAPACVNDEKKVQQLFERTLGVDEANGITSFMSLGGRMRARLTSPKMLRYQDTLPRMEFPNTLHVDFFDSTLNVENQVDAHFARYLETQNKILLKDSVRVFNIQGDTLFCQELWWDQTNQRFETEKPVRIFRKGMIINGVGLSAPQDFKTFTIYQITNSILRVSQGINSPDSTAMADTAKRKE